MTMVSAIKCGNCGAQMVPSQVDGRTYHCPNCEGQVQANISTDQIREGMRLDIENVVAFMTQLAAALQGGFGDAATVTHGADGHVAHIEIDFDPHRFVAKRERSKVTTQVKKLVKGVALKTKEHPVSDWVELLQQAIAESLNDNNKVTGVLAQIRIK